MELFEVTNLRKLPIISTSLKLGDIGSYIGRLYHLSYYPDAAIIIEYTNIQVNNKCVFHVTG